MIIFDFFAKWRSRARTASRVEGACRFRLSDFLLSAGIAGIVPFFPHSGEK